MERRQKGRVFGMNGLRGIACAAGVFLLSCGWLPATTIFEPNDPTKPRQNPNQQKVDLLLQESLPLPELLRFELLCWSYLARTPGEDLEKYEKGARMTDEELWSVRRRLAETLRAEGNSLGKATIIEDGRILLHNVDNKGTGQYDVIAGPDNTLEMVYFQGLLIHHLAWVDAQGGIGRERGILKEADLPQFPEKWPFFDQNKAPTFPEHTLFEKGDVVLSKTETPAPAAPGNALGWAYPLFTSGKERDFRPMRNKVEWGDYYSHGGILGRGNEGLPTVGDVLWVTPREGGGLNLVYSGPNKNGLYAWVDDGLLVHWTKYPQENIAPRLGTFWPFFDCVEPHKIKRMRPPAYGWSLYAGEKNYDANFVSEDGMSSDDIGPTPWYVSPCFSSEWSD